MNPLADAMDYFDATCQAFAYEDWAAYAHDEDPFMRSLAAREEACPADLLAVLSEDAASIVLSSVARNPATPLATVERLAVVGDRSVRLNAALNEAGHVSVLTLLADDDSAVVRGAVAVIRETPVAILAGYVSDPEAEVRLGLANNPALPDSLCHALMLDEDRRVREVIGLRWGYMLS